MNQKGKKVISAYKKLIKAYEKAEKAMSSVTNELDYVWSERYDNCDANPLWDIAPGEFLERLQDGLEGMKQDLQEMIDEPEEFGYED